MSLYFCLDGVKFLRPNVLINVCPVLIKLFIYLLGTFENGKKFDSSRDRGKPFQFTVGVGEVIRGWDEGVLKMSVGERSTLTCSPDYGYGSKGCAGAIPPNSVLIFDVEFISIS